ncbi:MAG: hypothetical protein VX589_04975 [Myxococcota bacterium]|nr:hypothetical protein [Myxococcota bacterium]
MIQSDDFWDQIVEEGLLGPDQAGRARTRHAQVGGGMDTAVLEVVALDAHQINQLLGIASDVLNQAPALVEYIDAPDLEQLARLSNELVVRYGILPSKDLAGHPILVVPPLAPHAIQALRREVGEIQFVLGLESDIREALRRFANIALPARFEALWMGRCPSATSVRVSHPLGPVATPRKSSAIEWLTNDSHERMEPFPRSSGQSDGYDTGGPITRPGRPTALGLADTGEFREHHARSVAPTALSFETDDDHDALTIEFQSEEDLVDSSSSMLIRSTQDTSPPTS